MQQSFAGFVESSVLVAILGAVAGTFTIERVLIVLAMRDDDNSSPKIEQARRCLTDETGNLHR